MTTDTTSADASLVVDAAGHCRLFRLCRDTRNVYIKNSVVDQIFGGAALGQAIGNSVDTMVSMGRLSRECWVSFDPAEWNLAASATFIGPDRILLASDYPHPEYRPEVVDELRKGIAMAEPDQRRILDGNAADAYRLPLNA